MVDCAVILSHSVVQGVSQRNLRVQKYRGSAFDENESPFLITKAGFDVALARTPGQVDARSLKERVSSGVERLEKLAPSPVLRIVGTLGQTQTVLRALGLQTLAV